LIGTDCDPQPGNRNDRDESKRRRRTEGVTEKAISDADDSLVSDPR
jgi:hypothetical protein